MIIFSPRPLMQKKKGAARNLQHPFFFYVKSAWQYTHLPPLNVI